MYFEWRRTLGSGTKRRQVASIKLEAQTRLFRWYEPLLVPGMLHTAEYAEAVMRRVIDFYGIPDDLEAGVAARMERQQILYRGDHRFHFILAEQGVALGIIPAHNTCRVSTNQFIMFDDRMVHVDTISAELTISQPREIAVYAKAFQELSKSTVYGQDAKDLIGQALGQLRQGRTRTN